MKKVLSLITFVWFYLPVSAQELYVSTEPASNMARNGLRLRMSNESVPESDFKSRTTFSLMYGLSKDLMLGANAYMADFYQRRQHVNGYSFYAKYRFLNMDNVQRHFRGAIFGQYTDIKYPIIHDEINLNGENKGFQNGVVFTQLLHKLALSGSFAFTKSLDKLIPGHEALHDNARSSLAYTFSTGYLVFPKEYKNYKQINTNLYVEFIGDSHTSTGRNFMDVAPAAQFIFNSKIRVDLSRRKQLWGNMDRRFKNMYLVRVEYNLFNVF